MKKIVKSPKEKPPIVIKSKLSTGNNKTSVSTSVTSSLPESQYLKPRHTQRLPKVCIPCSTKKIKCDKKLPCDNCTKIGKPQQCAREVVVVKGRLYNENRLMKNVSKDTNPVLVPYIYEIQRLEKELKIAQDKLENNHPNDSNGYPKGQTNADVYSELTQKEKNVFVHENFCEQWNESKTRFMLSSSLPSSLNASGGGIVSRRSGATGGSSSVTTRSNSPLVRSDAKMNNCSSITSDHNYIKLEPSPNLSNLSSPDSVILGSQYNRVNNDVPDNDNYNSTNYNQASIHQNQTKPRIKKDPTTNSKLNYSSNLFQNQYNSTTSDQLFNNLDHDFNLDYNANYGVPQFNNTNSSVQYNSSARLSNNSNRNNFGNVMQSFDHYNEWNPSVSSDPSFDEANIDGHHQTYKLP